MVVKLYSWLAKSVEVSQCMIDLLALSQNNLSTESYERNLLTYLKNVILTFKIFDNGGEVLSATVTTVA